PATPATRREIPDATPAPLVSSCDNGCKRGGGGEMSWTTRRAILLTIGATGLAALIAPGTALAHTASRSDGNDVRGPPDIKAIREGHRGLALTHRVTTFDPWRSTLLGTRTPNLIALSFDTGGTAAPERWVFVLYANGR